MYVSTVGQNLLWGPIWREVHDRDGLRSEKSTYLSSWEVCPSDSGKRWCHSELQRCKNKTKVEMAENFMKEQTRPFWACSRAKLNLSSSKYLLTCFDSTHVFTYLYVDNSSMDMCMEKGRERRRRDTLHSVLSVLIYHRDYFSYPSSNT